MMIFLFGLAVYAFFVATLLDAEIFWMTCRLERRVSKYQWSPTKICSVNEILINNSRTCAPRRAILDCRNIRTTNDQSPTLALVLADHLVLQILPKGST